MGIINREDLKYILDLKNSQEFEILINKAIDINNSNNNIKLESNIYYPTFYQIANNCPTCGYRTPESKREYNPNYIKKVLEYKIDTTLDYDISAINCYDKGENNLEDLKLVMDVLKKYDLKINVKISNFDNLGKILDMPIDSIIIDLPQDYKHHVKLRSTSKFDKDIFETIRIINQHNNISINGEFLINNNERDVDVYNVICDIKKYNIQSLEIKGYDPFYDSPEEYNPQYNQEYFMKIISIFRIIYPNLELKMQYAHNGNNNLEKSLKIGIGTITGVYTDRTILRLFNIEEILENIN